MKPLNALFLAILTLLFVACGIARPPNPTPVLDSCKSRVIENAYIPGVPADKVIKQPNPGYNRCFTEQGMVNFARVLACDSGYAMVSLVNIQKPGFFAGSCYNANLEFYKNDSGFRLSDVPVLHYDSISPKGLQIAIRLNAGTVVDGIQETSGLISENGDTASTSKTGIYFTSRYFFLPFLGVELETGATFGSAHAKGTKDMNLTKAWSTNFGLNLIPWQTMFLLGRFQTVLSGGINYTRLAFADEIKDFMWEKQSIRLVDDAATGMGWYSGADLRLIFPSGMLYDLGIRYYEEYPKFPLGTKAYTAANLFFDLSVGYQF